MFNLLNDALGMVANIMHYILIGTIILGSIFALIVLVMIVKRLKYNKQMRENKKIREKIIKNEPLEDEKTSKIWCFFVLFFNFVCHK